MIVGSREEFYKNLSYDADSWFLFICNRKGIKFPDHLSADPVKLIQAYMLSGYEGDTAFFPFPVKRVGRSLDCFVRTHAVNTFHKDISEYCTECKAGSQFCSNFKSWIFFQAAQINGDYRNVSHICFLQSTADESDVVGSTAAAACLGHNDSYFVQIIFSGQKCLHNLTDYHKRRVAGIIVYIFQSDIHGFFVVIWKHLQIVTAGIEGSLQNVKVDG